MVSVMDHHTSRADACHSSLFCAFGQRQVMCEQFWDPCTRGCQATCFGTYLALRGLPYLLSSARRALGAAAKEVAHEAGTR